LDERLFHCKCNRKRAQFIGEWYVLGDLLSETEFILMSDRLDAHFVFLGKGK